ncbi:hypothetical protein LCGC14_1863910 [marine sediment metagenome]|uniref:Uncharacterized protein n=1 Tax=marine sediment metagenome TaxID=412755 RepID=A0A0F9G710_9ZZZZ
MNDSATKPTYLEFEDPDDPESDAHESSKRKTSFKIGVQPEMYLLAMIKDPNALESDVLPAVRQLMYASYLQGKRVRREVERKGLTNADKLD